MKKILIALGVALGILILLMLLAPLLFKGKIRELAVRQANKNINATVSLGDIHISLFRNFPNVFIGLENLTLTNQEPFPGDTLAHLPTLAMTVNLADLFSGSPYSVDRIRLDRPDVRLKVTHDGTANWDIALPGDTTEVTGDEEPSSFTLRLKSFRIEKGRLVYDDVSTRTYVLLEGLDHRLSGDLTADRTSMVTRTSVEEAYVEYAMVPYLNRAHVTLDAAFDADLENSIYRLEKNSLKINELMLDFDGSVGVMGEDLNLLINFQAPENAFKNVLSLLPAIYAKEFSSVETAGTFTLKGFVKGIYNENTLPAFRVELDVTDAWFRYPDLPGTVKDISLDALVENPGGDADNTVVDISDLSFTIIDNTVEGALNIRTPISDPDIDLSAKGKLDLSDITRVYPLEEGEELHGVLNADIQVQGKMSDLESENYRNFQAMGYFHANDLTYRSAYLDLPVTISVAQVNVSPAYLDLVSLEAVTGNSDLRAKGRINDYLAWFLDDGKLKGDLSFDADRIDLNELMASGPEEEALLAVADTVRQLPDTTELSPYLVPAYIEMTLSATIARLDYETILMENLKGDIEIIDSKIVMKGLRSDVFGGSMLLNGFYETTDPSSPVIDVVMGLTNASVSEVASHIPVLEKYAPIALETSGTVSGNISLSSVLDNAMMPLYETVTGTGNIRTSRLEVSGVNTLNALADALKMENLRSLQIDPVNLSFQFMEGTLNVKPFDIEAGNIDMNLQGWTSLNQEIGYELLMKVPRSAFGAKANEVLGDIVSGANRLGTDFTLGETVELKALIDGTLTDPKLSLDLAGTGKGIVEEVKEQVKETVTEKVTEEAEKILSDAQARADAIMAKAQSEADKLMENADRLAQEARNQANVNAQKLEDEAKDKGALAVMAAKKAADEVRKEGDRQAQNILDEARKQKDNILSKAQQEADAILEEARKKADSL